MKPIEEVIEPKLIQREIPSSKIEDDLEVFRRMAIDLGAKDAAIISTRAGAYHMSRSIEFAPPSDEEIIEILDLVNESDFDELRLEMKGFNLTVSKHPQEPDREPSMSGAGVPDDKVTSSEQTEPGKSNNAFGPQASPSREQASQVAEEKYADLIDKSGFVPVKSPLLGIFYRAPKPGAPPFVEVGSYVNENDTVCLIEVMKLFNTVKAGARGRIVEVCAEDNQMVEYDQVLFLINPEEAPEESSGALFPLFLCGWSG